MHTEHRLVVHAEAARAYELAAAILDWPRILPHYRWVRSLRQEGSRHLVAMGAVHNGIPLSWRCEQELEPHVPRILFRHVSGITNGMTAEWNFAPTSDGLVVSVLHDLKLDWPLFADFVSDRIIGPYFVDPISAKTLATICELAELQRGGTGS